MSERDKNLLFWFGVVLLIALFGSMGIIYTYSHPWGIALFVVAGIVAIVLAVYLIPRKIRAHKNAKEKAVSAEWERYWEPYRKTESAERGLDSHIKMALIRMESIDDSYTDEDSANQQLCLLLRGLAPGADIQLVKTGSKGKGDIKVGDTIIEGKMDLVTKDELDRLIGQLQDYCDNSDCQIRVVVYGKLRSDFRRRIEGLERYRERILLYHGEGIKTRHAGDGYE